MFKPTNEELKDAVCSLINRALELNTVEECSPEITYIAERRMIDEFGIDKKYDPRYFYFSDVDEIHNFRVNPSIKASDFRAYSYLVIRTYLIECYTEDYFNKKACIEMMQSRLNHEKAIIKKEYGIW